ncbi:MAG: hypothetical protein C4522_01945 [Desulfobacteraceae bacterium]|nr:MAG: hypothetical protein C4522_01945 [Desulfobacteraceae bacterium]
MTPVPGKKKYLPNCLTGWFFLIFLSGIIPVSSLPAKDSNTIDSQTEAADPGLSRDEESRYRTLFRKLFYSVTYNSLKCHENIYSLLEKAGKEGLDLTGVRVVFIFDKDHDKLLSGKSSNSFSPGIQRPTITMYKTRIVYNRNDPPGEFRFHAFAIFQDKIMDFDYTNSPRLVPAMEYFSHMFSPEKMNQKEREALFNRLTIRAIPAKDYLHYNIQHTSWYLFDLETKFPSQSLHHFLLDLSDRNNIRTPGEKKS